MRKAELVAKNNWQSAAYHCSLDNVPYVLATIVGTSGSTPRASGGKMLITADRVVDTIGGGQFEALVIEHARGLLSQPARTQDVQHYPLAAAAMQCCGGSVTVLFESFGLNVTNVVIFGAGHVGSRISQLLAELPAFTTLVDSRSEWLDAAQADSKITGEPTDYLAQIPSGSVVLVLTHDHLLDYQILAQLIEREDLPFIGLIGSKTKWRNFQRRLRRDGASDTALARVTCPIGLPNVKGKAPMSVAVAVVAQLLEAHLEEPAASEQAVSRPNSLSAPPAAGTTT